MKTSLPITSLINSDTKVVGSLLSSHPSGIVSMCRLDLCDLFSRSSSRSRGKQFDFARF